MVNSGCLNGDLNTTMYNSPMPAMGVYIAIACFVCFVSIVFDIFSSIRRRKLCLPSKLFAFNSFTLTVISVATKLPVDLNTAMPRAVDQLSKLTSTGILFMSMGLFMSSIGTMRMSECLTNMAALTVLVITVVVNVCIQICTGVIFAFTIEHWIVLSCTLILLALLWSSTSFLDVFKNISGHSKLHIDCPSEWSSNSMKRHVKTIYTLGYSSNPQLFMSQTPVCSSVGLLCAIVSLVLVEAIISVMLYEVDVGKFANKGLIFCKKESDYKWSIWCIVVTQTFIIIVTSFILLFRWLVPISHVSLPAFKFWEGRLKFLGHWTLGLQTHRHLPLPFEFNSKSFMIVCRVTKEVIMGVLIGMQKGMVLASHLVVLSCLILKKPFTWLTETVSIYFRFCTFKSSEDREIDSSSSEYMEIYHSVFTYYEDNASKEWIARAAVDNMKILMGESERDDLTYLIQHLPKTIPPQPSLLKEIIMKSRQDAHHRVSCLTIVVLARFATILKLSALSDSLECILKEAFELVYFIDERMSTEDIYNKWRYMAAKVLWLNLGSSNDIFEKKIIAPVLKGFRQHVFKPMTNEVHKNHDLDESLSIVEAFTEIKSSYDDLFQLVLDREFCNIGKCILNNSYASVSELNECIERTFVELLRSILTYLPLAIFKEYCKSSMEENEESIRRAMKFLCKLEVLEDKVSWLWPNETNLNRPRSYLDSIGDESSSHITSGETTIAENILQVEGGVATLDEHIVGIVEDDSGISPIPLMK